MRKTIKIGVGGPVGSGKTSLIEKLCFRLRDKYKIGAITNDIYTKEDQKILTKSGALEPDKIIGVETGGCPHTAIREDISMNLDALDELMGRYPDLNLIFIESGGDNLAATFSPELVDGVIFVIDVGEGEKIPRKGGPGITQSELLVINKIDIAPLVHSDLDVMERDTKRMRGDKPFVFTDLYKGIGLDTIVDWINNEMFFEDIK